MNTTLTKISTRVWLLAFATGLFAVLNAQAGKPVPRPAPPPAIAYRQAFGQAGIYTITADGGSRTRILKEGGTVGYRTPLISPDGKKLAVRQISPDALCVANMDGSKLSVLFAFSAAESQQTPWLYKTWSPDGNYLAFSGPVPASNYPQIIRATIGFDELGEPVASDMRVLTTGSNVMAVDPSWSPAWVPGQ